MAAKKRSPAQREADLALLASWAVEGLTVSQLAERLNRHHQDDGAGYALTPQQVGRDVKVVLTRWRAEQQAAADLAQARVAAELKHLKRQAWQAWHRSCEPRSVSLVEQTTGQAGDRRRASQRVTQRPGDPRFLMVILAALDREAKLFGLDDADQDLRHFIRREAEDFARELGLSADDVLAEAEALIRRLGER